MFSSETNGGFGCSFLMGLCFVYVFRSKSKGDVFPISHGSGELIAYFSFHDFFFSIGLV